MDYVMIETGWLSILPPIIAIVLALITKEVYSSLFLPSTDRLLALSSLLGVTVNDIIVTR